MAKTRSTAFLFLNSSMAAMEKEVDFVVSALNMHKAITQSVTDKDSFIKGETSGLNATQIEVESTSTTAAQTFSEAEKLAVQGGLYGQSDQVVQPGSHSNNLANVSHPCVIEYSLPVEGSVPRSGYLMLYSGQDFKHSNIMCCQGLAPSALAKHNVVVRPQSNESELDVFPQQLAYPWIVKISNSTAPGDYKYLIFYSAENQNIDGTRQNFSKIYAVKWTGVINEYSGAMTGLSAPSLIINNNQDIQQVFAPYVEADIDTGNIYIWFTGTDSLSNTSAIYYATSTIDNILNISTPLTIPLVPYLSLSTSTGLLELNDTLMRKSGAELNLSGHIISFRATLVENKASSGTGAAKKYRYFWLSVECESAAESEYITLFGKTSTEVTPEYYNPDIFIENVVGDINDFPSATKRCYCPSILKRTITDADSGSVDSPDLFDIWWSTGSFSKNFISYSGNKAYTSKTWVDSPASSVFNEALNFSEDTDQEASSSSSSVSVFTRTDVDNSVSLAPLRLPISLIDLNSNSVSFDLSKRIKYTVNDAISAKDDDPKIVTNTFDAYTGRNNKLNNKYLEDYSCKDNDTLDLIAAYYYNNQISDLIPFGPLQFSGLIAEINDVCDADLYPGLKLKIPDPRFFNNVGS